MVRVVGEPRHMLLHWLPRLTASCRFGRSRRQVRRLLSRPRERDERPHGLLGEGQHERLQRERVLRHPPLQAAAQDSSVGKQCAGL